MRGYVLIVVLLFSGALSAQEKDSRFVSLTTEAKSINLYWKNSNNQILGSIQNVKALVEGDGKSLRFAMNGGMYLRDQSPQGLFVQDGIQHTQLDTASCSGNFYLKPNGIFYITKNNQAVIRQTKDFIKTDIKLATQSGPMLLIDGEIHPAFRKGSVNLNIRNGVGILPDGGVIFAMSKAEINFHDFALFFKDMGCKNALYLDGFVSRTYLPEENWTQLDGSFGVIIGVLK